MSNISLLPGANISHIHLPVTVSNHREKKKLFVSSFNFIEDRCS